MKVFNLSRLHQDKTGHFIAGVLIYYTTLHFIDPFVGLLSVAVVAVGKEVFDCLHRDKHTPDMWDAVATLLGGIIGFIAGM